MKILFITGSLSRTAGGLFNSVRGLAQALVERGVEVTAHGGADRHFEEDRAAWGAVSLLPYTSEGSYRLHPAALAEAIRSRPDLVHVHGIWSAVSIYGLATSAAGAAAVVSPRGMLEPWILARRPMVKRAHAALFERPLLRRAWVHALNEAEREHVTAFMPGAEGRTFVVPNGVQEPSPGGPAATKDGTLFLGRWHSKKQLVPLIRVWRTLATRPHLTIAGWGAADYEAEVREAAAGAPNIEIVGPLHGEAKSAALRRARFFILPSLSEGMPMAVLEAIGEGCVPIITPECNLPELFAEGIAIRIESNFADFADAVDRANRLPAEEAARRSAAAKAYARGYAWPRIADAMIAQYERCLAARPRRPR